jgi:hypothetical protein
LTPFDSTITSGHHLPSVHGFEFSGVLSRFVVAKSAYAVMMELGVGAWSLMSSSPR